jgi:hypothetical protein
VLVRPLGEEPKRLVVDIETFPMLFYAWQPYEARALRVIKDTSMASFSARWIGGKTITRCLADYEGYEPNSRDDRALCADLWPLLNEAHIVIAHNGVKFDRKKINYRFMVHKMGPPSPYKLVDTLREVKRVAGFDSNRLNELARQLEIGEKLRTGGADLWFDCLEGKPAAWRRMKRYNTRDVVLLEELYGELLPWMSSHPNWGAYMSGAAVCPKCGSAKLTPMETTIALTRSYRQYQCQSCGGWCRSSETVGDRATLLNIAA